MYFILNIDISEPTEEHNPKLISPPHTYFITTNSRIQITIFENITQLANLTFLEVIQSRIHKTLNIFHWPEQINLQPSFVHLCFFNKYVYTCHGSAHMKP